MPNSSAILVRQRFKRWICTLFPAMLDAPLSGGEMRDDSNLIRLLQSAAGGSQPALGELLERYRARLRQLLRLRLDRRVRGRVDPSDVIQDTLVEASRRLLRSARPMNGLVIVHSGSCAV
jgi:hypothetical protein